MHGCTEVQYCIIFVVQYYKHTWYSSYELYSDIENRGKFSVKLLKYVLHKSYSGDRYITSLSWQTLKPDQRILDQKVNADISQI